MTDVTAPGTLRHDSSLLRLQDLWAQMCQHILD